MKGTKEQKGITLIALIITIVVLLILAVVAINSIQNEGILAHATNSAGTYNNSVSNEQSTLTSYEDFLKYQSCPKHTFVEGVCSNCGYPCQHNWLLAESEGEKSVCKICELECSHDEITVKYVNNSGEYSHDEVNVCKICELEYNSGSDGYHDFNSDGKCIKCEYQCYIHESWLLNYCVDCYQPIRGNENLCLEAIALYSEDCPVCFSPFEGNEEIVERGESGESGETCISHVWTGIGTDASNVDFATCSNCGATCSHSTKTFVEYQPEVNWHWAIYNCTDVCKQRIDLIEDCAEDGTCVCREN